MSWFNARAPRERVLLMILAGLLVVFVAWFAITRERGPNGASALEAAQTDRELWLRAAPRLGTPVITGDRSEFTRGSLVDMARKRGVNLSRVDTQSGGSLSVWIDDAPTTALYGWIEDLVTGYSVKVDDVQMTTAPNGGVNARLTLTPI